MGIAFASADREPGVYTSDIVVPRDSFGLLFHAVYSAEGGATAVLDIKFQYYDPASDTYEDLKDSAGNTIAFTQFTGVSEDDLTIYPGIVEKLSGNNKHYAEPCPRKLRVVATVGADNLTFSLGAIGLA